MTFIDGLMGRGVGKGCGLTRIAHKNLVANEIKNCTLSPKLEQMIDLRNFKLLTFLENVNLAICFWLYI